MGIAPSSGPESIDLDPSEAEAALQDEKRVTKTVTGKPELFNPAGAPDMPEARPGAIEAAREKQQPTGEYSGVTDKLGNPFDPSIHENDGGVPRMAGDHVRRKRGGHAQSASKRATASKVDPSGGKPPVDQTAVSLQAQIDATAATATGLTFMVGCMIGGPEFKPEEGEPEAMHGAWKAVCEKYGMTDLPPVAALIAITGMYAGKRWHRPIFKEKRIGWVQKVKRWWFRKELEKEAKIKAEQLRAKNNTPTPRPNVVEQTPVKMDDENDPLGDWSKP